MSIAMPALVETYFDPDDDLEQRVVAEIRGARRSVWIQAYKFGSEAIVETILQRKRETPELDIRLALDAREAAAARDKKQGRLLERIRAAGGQIGYVADADKAHSKFIVIDSEIVLTGSFNFKQHLDRVQRDNVVVIRSQEVARTYVAKFEATARSAEVEDRPPNEARAALAGRQAGKRSKWRPFRSVRALLVGGFALALIFSSFGAFAAEWLDDALEAYEYEFTGPLEALPPDGLIGTWQVDGRLVQVTSATQIDLPNGPPPLGALVEVEGSLLADGSVAAAEIDQD